MEHNEGLSFILQQGGIFFDKYIIKIWLFAEQESPIALDVT
jgi:hypothetical protein